MTAKKLLGISHVSIHDPETVWKDPSAKTIGFFSRRQQVALSLDSVNELRRMAEDAQDNVRLSLHGGPDSAFHEMIIVQYWDKYSRPKRHITKAKSFHIIEGRMAVFIFDEKGTVLDACLLDGRNRFIYRVAAGLYHTNIAVTDYMIHHESTLGPFMGDADREYAPFAPPHTEREAYLRYREELLMHIDSSELAGQT